MNFKERVEDLLNFKPLNEEIVKPSKKDKKRWKETGGNGSLFFVIKSKEGKNLGFIDSDYVEKIRSKKNNPNLSPKAVAHYRLSSVEWFKKNK